MVDEQVKLHIGDLELALSPSIGGSIARFDWTGEGSDPFPLMRGCHSGSTNVLEAACFPLVPFVNRIRGSRFTFRGREVVMQPNMAGDPSVLHGQGWLGRWNILFANEAETELAYEHQAGEWPWTYEARQHFALDAGGLTVRLSCFNTSTDPMPCGLGLHPYFHCGPDTVLGTHVTDVWDIDENVLPLAKGPAIGRFDLDGRHICGQGLDHGFAGWGGEARISDTDWPVELVMSSPDAHFFQLYSPREGGLFVAEPVTHANAALNEPEEEWPELGVRVLKPGEEMTLSMRLDVKPD
ncbi:aldose 1-epimerase [Sphingomonas alba]|uniref:Aldose 1-epimerase n=1 Tax=Sphingomonas alba TaxID=2908208 RepID=A0ABT0RJ39_9SPHN|nr:aldose 1-epimerase [Sphingomonas alba]MCL6682654.1 aldose 1-epimerase [Sphingomonas alba]